MKLAELADVLQKCAKFASIIAEILYHASGP